MAAYPAAATLAGSAFSSWPTFVSINSARSKNSVSVGQGIRQVTVPPVSFNSFRHAVLKLSTTALVPLYTACKEPGMNPALDTVTRISTLGRAPCGERMGQDVTFLGVA